VTTTSHDILEAVKADVALQMADLLQFLPHGFQIIAQLSIAEAQQPIGFFALLQVVVLPS
jgi:hypothetical protein